jgi:hypothetical protein
MDGGVKACTGLGLVQITAIVRKIGYFGLYRPFENKNLFLVALTLRS